MPTTSRGAPYPGDGPGVPNDVPGDLRALAEWASDRPGITTMSSATRTALGPDERWEGRLVYETDTNRLLVRVMGAWRLLSREDTLGGEWQATTLTLGGPATITPGSTPAYRARRQGRTVTLKGAVQVTSGGGIISFTYPPIAGTPVLLRSRILLGYAQIATSELIPIGDNDGKMRMSIPNVVDRWLTFHVEYEVPT